MCYFISQDLHLCLDVIKDLVTAVGVIPHRRSANKDITPQSFLYSPLNSPVTSARNRKTLLPLTQPDLKTLFTDKRGPVRTQTEGRVSEAARSKPGQLRGASVPVLPGGTEKNDIIFL